MCVCVSERERDERARAMRKEQRVRQTKHKHKWFLQLSLTDLWVVAHVRRLLRVCVGVCVLKRERKSTHERASERKGARERLRTPKRELNDSTCCSLQGFAVVVRACTTERLRAHTLPPLAHAVGQCLPRRGPCFLSAAEFEFLACADPHMPEDHRRDPGENEIPVAGSTAINEGRPCPNP